MNSHAETVSKGEITRLHLLRSAEDAFAESGFDAASLETVAENVGIKRAAIFYHFRSKQQLYEEVAAAIDADLIAVTQRRLAGTGDPWDQLLRLIDTWLAFMASRPTAARIVLRKCSGTSTGHAGDHGSGPVTLMREIISRGIATGRFAEIDAMHLVNLLTGSILHYVCNPEQLGTERRYRPDDPSEVETFRRVLHVTARAVLNVQPVQVTGDGTERLS